MSNRLFALGAAGVLLAAGVVTSAGTSEGGPAPVSFPEMTFVASPLVDGVDDGLARFVVEVAVRAPHVDRDGLGRALAALDAAGVEHAAEGSDDALRPRDAGSVEAVPVQPVPSASGAPAPTDPTPLDDVDGVEQARWVDGRHVAIATTLSVEALTTLPDVMAVAEDPVVSTFAAASSSAASSTDRHIGQLWGLDNQGQTVRGSAGTSGVDVGWSAARQHATGDGVVVAVIDSGVQLDHPDLADRIWRNPGETCDNGVDDDANGYVDDCVGWDFARNDATVDDPGADNGHGTHVAGTIAATVDNGIGIAGVAPRASIMPLKVFDGGGSPASRGAAAIRYAVDNGADVLNLSWGTRAGTPADPVTVGAIEHARANGVLVVAAAGNEGVDTDRAPVHPASLPHANIVSVGAGTNGDGRASFSNHGRTTVDLFAPGHHVLSTVPDSGYGWASGTSMAAPHVAGVAALAVQHLGTADAATVRRELFASTIGGQAYASSATAGRVDAAELLGVGGGLLEVTASGIAGLEQAGAGGGAVAELRLQVATDRAVDPALELQLTLAYEHDGALRAVVDHPLVLDDGAETVTTAAGRMPLAAGPLGTDRAGALVSGGLDLAATFDVPAGRWAVVAELVDPATQQRTGSPQLLLFTVTATGDEPAPADTAPVDGAANDGAANDGAATGGPPPGGASAGGSSPGGSSPGPSTPGPSTPGPSTPGPSTPGPSTPGPSKPGPSTPGDAPAGSGQQDAPAPLPSIPTSPGAGAGTGGGGAVVTGPPPDGSASDVGRPTAPEQPPSAGGGGASSGGTDAAATTSAVVTPDSVAADRPAVVQVRNPGYEGRVRVWFGGQAGTVLVVTPDWLLVEVPPMAPGTVDVHVHGPAGQVTTHTAALRVTGGAPAPAVDGADATVPGTDTVVVPAPELPGPVSPGPVSPGPGSPGPGPPGSDGPAPGPPGTGAPELQPPGSGAIDTPPGPRRGVVGEPTTLPNGLRVATFAADEPANHVAPSDWNHRACVDDPCTARSA